MKKMAFVYAILLVFVPTHVSAGVYISEIMYDASGTDAQHEWVEIHNDGSSSIDLADWKFYENDTNHGLSVVQGSSSLGAGNYAIIADNASTFLSDFPSYTGTLFDSVFSLNNTGETLEIRNSSLEIIDTASYTSSSGAAGDGNTLHGSGSSWQAGMPTPGFAMGSSSQESSSSNSTTNVQNQATTQSVTTYWGTLDIPNVITAQTDNTYSVTIERNKNDETQGLRTGIFQWNFGDGVLVTRDNDEEVTHTYHHPGTYVLVFEYYRGVLHEKPHVRFEQVVTVIDAGISIADITSGGDIVLDNESSSMIDLSGWTLTSNGQTFMFPDNSYMSANGSMILARSTTGFTLVPNPVVVLGNDTGVIQYTYPHDRRPSVSSVTSSASNEVSHNPQSELLASAIESHNNPEQSFVWLWRLLGVVLIAIAVFLIFKPRPERNGDENAVVYDDSDEYEMYDM